MAKDLKSLRYHKDEQVKTKIWFQVRQALPSDAEALMQLLEQLGYPISSKAEMQRILDKYSVGQSKVVLADTGSKVIGFLALHIMPAFHIPTEVGLITAFCIDKDHRNNGVGRRLLDAAEDVFRLYGCDRIELNSSLKPEREVAHKFYKIHGFQEKRVRYVKMLKA